MASIWPRSRLFAGRRLAARKQSRATGIAVGLGAEQVQVGLQHVRHDEAGTCTQRPIDRGDGVVDVALQLVKRCLIRLDACCRGASQRMAEVVSCRHLSVSQHEWCGAGPLGSGSLSKPAMAMLS